MVDEDILKILPPDLREAYKDALEPEIPDYLKAHLLNKINSEPTEEPEFTKARRAKDNE